MWKRIIFGRSSGYYLFYASALYFFIGMYDIFVYRFAPVEMIQIAWVSALAGPFIIPPIGRYFNMDVTWDQKMFNWFKKKPTNVVQFPGREPGASSAPPAPPRPADPPKEKTPAVTYYSLGMTSENRLELKMGYSAITMNHGGVSNLIDQLEVFKQQLAEYEGIEEEQDGN